MEIWTHSQIRHFKHNGKFSLILISYEQWWNAHVFDFIVFGFLVRLYFYKNGCKEKK
jgi:hypothetical protein